MKSIKDSFYLMITAFFGFVINLLSGGKRGKSEKAAFQASSCGNSGNLSVNNNDSVENKPEKSEAFLEKIKLPVQRGTYKIRVPCTCSRFNNWLIMGKGYSNRADFAVCTHPHRRTPDPGS